MEQLRDGLDSFVRNQNIELLKGDKRHQNHNLLNFSVNEDDFQTVKVQLRALGLISKSAKTRSVKDTDTYWTLTPYGDDVMTQLRAVKRVLVPEEKPRAFESEESH